jgi:CRISPR-associated endoribonuclease Cas6
MTPNFSFQHFRFHLAPKSVLRMPAYNKGNVIRGGFGSAFRRLVCHGGCREPETCELRAVCPYTAVFHPFVPDGSEKVSKNRDIPRPFVIKPPLETTENYSAGARLVFDMIVVGKAKDYLPHFIVTLKELSNVGLGWNRTVCDLSSVEAVSVSGDPWPVYSSGDNMVRPPKDAILWSDLSMNGDSAHKGRRRMKIKFLTPTALKVDGRFAERPRFSHIAKRLRDRISALSYFYCGQGLDIDFKAFGEMVERIVTVEDRTHWVSSSRYSRRRDVEHDLSGFVGEVVFEGELEPFVPYLKLGEYLHVGKNAVFGNGWYKIEELGGDLGEPTLSKT